MISGSVPNSQTAACWVVIPNNGTLAIVSNTGSGTISTYNIDASGMLTLANAVAADTGADSAPRDMALSVNGQILFVQTEGGQSVAVFHIENDGTLMPVDTAGGLPFGAQGIAARKASLSTCIADAIRPRCNCCSCWLASFIYIQTRC